MTGFYLFLICFASICVRSQILNKGDYLNDYPPVSIYMSDNEQDTGYVNYPKPEIVRQQSGNDMVLKCSTTSCLYLKQNSVWEFKACQPDFKKISCSNYYDTSNKDILAKNVTWDPVSGHVLRHKCAVNLHLQKINTSFSGLYRCITDEKIIKIYEVIVLDSLNKYSYQPPELLDVIPLNTTIASNMQVIIQCRVYSQRPPVIWWFKESDESNYDIKYSGKYYLQINTSVQVYGIPHESNVYLSKMYIYHAQGSDSGKYVCFAMTASGMAHKDASIKVITNDTYWESDTSFVLLFLIPITFALIPITIWLCYYRKKKKSIKKLSMHRHQSSDAVRPMLTERMLSNSHTIV
ncbi:hypothetical protein RN001_012259 [Aquatica leii]|uniref:Ig-like domain-containing protein n=1 Tax=Aquatica leii TaxID=1421715 RepID=A0AAN7SD80_9COLE|nr:hypothetical protein RN001_012259 [Aquatica leii]